MVKKYLIVLSMVSSSLLLASQQPARSTLATKVKAAAILGVVSFAQLVQGQQLLANNSLQIIPSNASECLPTPAPFAHAQCIESKRYAEMIGIPDFTIDCDPIHSAITKIPLVNIVESKEAKESRELAESRVQQLLAGTHALALDLPDSQSKTCKMYLQEKGYQVANGKLINRLHMYKQRYPVNFGTFLQKTNEKQLTQQVMDSFITHLSQLCPAYFSNTIQMFDIGCGDGEFSSSLVATLGKSMPQGAKSISFMGIDPQPSFVKKTHELVNKLGAKSDVMVGDFMKDPLKPTMLRSSHFIIASHSAYVFLDLPKFIEKVEAMLAKNGFAIFLHNGDTPINMFRKKFPTILKQPVSNNIVEKIDDALKSSGLFYSTLDFKPTLKFPHLTQKEWKQLRSVAYADFAVDYSDWKPDVLQAKKLIEFFIQDPLEAFTQKERDIILPAFNDLLHSCNHEIPLLNAVQIVAARDSDKQLHDAIQNAVKNTGNK